MKKYKFIPGLELNRKFYHEVVGPLLSKEFPDLKYSAALTANGSDVLGYDDETSMDHNWGPRMQILLPEKDFKQVSRKIDLTLRRKLPPEFMGFPTNFTDDNENSYLRQQMKLKKKGPINHYIEFFTVKDFFGYYCGLNPYNKITIKDWLTTPEQALIEVTAGEVFHDQLNFSKYRSKLEYYPEDIWVYLIYVQWHRLKDGVSFPSRTGMNHDEIGSRMIANHVVEDMVKMLFLYNKRYQPYVKWRGESFKSLQGSKELGKILTSILDAKSWKVRQKRINQAHLLLGKMYNDLKISKPVTLREKVFYGRNYSVVDVDPVVESVKRAVKDKKLINSKHYRLGAIDQFTDHMKLNHLDYVYKSFKEIIK